VRANSERQRVCFFRMALTRRKSEVGGLGGSEKGHRSVEIAERTRQYQGIG